MNDKLLEYKVVYGSNGRYWSKIFQTFHDAALFAGRVRQKYGCPVCIRQRGVTSWKDHLTITENF